MLQKMIILHRESSLAFQTLLKVDLSHSKVPDTRNLPSISLVLATDEPGKLTECSIGGFTFFALTFGETTVLCVADPTESRENMENVLKEIHTLLEGRKKSEIIQQSAEINYQIRKLIKSNVTTELILIFTCPFERPSNIFGNIFSNVSVSPSLCFCNSSTVKEKNFRILCRLYSELS